MVRKRSEFSRPFAAQLRIGAYKVEPTTGLVSNRQGESRLEPRAMDLLSYLAQRPGEVISVEQLRRDIWGTDHLVEEVVRRCISQIRKAFEDDPNNPTYIETVRKRGYRLIAAAVSDTPDEPRLTSTLSTFRALSSAFFGALLLICAYGIWVLTQDTAGVVDNALPDNVDWHSVARNQYYEYDQESMESAIALYDSLIKTKRDDSKALAGLADALMQKYLRWDSRQFVADRAKAAALQSIRIDPRPPDAFKSLGAYYHFRGEHSKAIKFYRAAIQRDDSYWTALNNGGEILRDSGAFDIAKQWFQCALDSTDDREGVMTRIADVELRNANVESATETLELVHQMSPGNMDAGLALAKANLLVGNYSATLTVCDRLEEKAGQVQECGVLRGIHHWTNGNLDAGKKEFRAVIRTHPNTLAGREARTRLVVIDEKRASRVRISEIDSLRREISAESGAGELSSGDLRFLEAQLFAATGQMESLVAALADSVAAGATTLSWIDFDPAFTELRKDPAARELLAKKAKSIASTRPNGIRTENIRQYRLNGCGFLNRSAISPVMSQTRLNPIA